MFSAFLLLLIVVMWIYVRQRFRDLEARIDRLSSLVYQPLAPAVPVPQPRHPAQAPIAPREAPRPETPPMAPSPSVAESVAPLQNHTGRNARATDWEAVVGGNWLNKLGMLVLVIGMALALGYSFSYMGPRGRVAISLAASFLMLAAGIALERNDRYRIFARGMIGGGWAALYFTVYAMYAVDAARVVYNPWTAALLLMAVAVGMIVQSFRYSSEAVSGLAYIIAFVTLAITEVNAFSVIALVPLAASMLYIARRFRWPRFALLGLTGTYLTCAMRGDTGAPLWQAQSVFAIYWLLFEAYDLLSESTWLLPLNAAGFLGLSLVKWSSAAPDRLWQFLTVASAAYLASALLRARSGRWLGASIVTAGLAASAILLKLEGEWQILALLTEAELIYLTGLRLRARWLRYFAAGPFLLEIGSLMWPYSSVSIVSWTSIASVTAAVFYVNRFLLPSDTIYGYAGAAVLAWIAGRRAPNADRGLAWILLAPVPFAAGWIGRLADFRYQAYAIANLGLLAIVFRWAEPPGSLAAGAAVMFIGALTAMVDGRLSRSESELVRMMGFVGGAGLVALLLYREVSGNMLTVAWGAESVVLLAAGFPLRDRILRFYGIGLLLICILKLFVHDLSYLETLPRILSFIVLGLLLVGVSWLYTRYRERIQRYL